MNVSDAHRRLERAEGTVREAERARDEARDQLDQALAERGWHRFHVAAGPHTRLYARLGGNPTAINEVLDHELRAAA